MTTLKGIFPDTQPARKKNFIHENVKNLRRMEQFFHSNKEVEELHKLQMQRQYKAIDKYQNITSKIGSCKHEETSNKMSSEPSGIKAENSKQCPASKVSVPVLSCKTVAPVKKVHRPLANHFTPQKLRKAQRNPAENKSLHSKQRKAPSDPNLALERLTIQENIMSSSVKYKSQGIQTLDAEHMNSLYSNGIIRYPTSKSSRKNEMMNKGESSQQTDITPREEVSAPSDRGDISVSPTPREAYLDRSNSPLHKEEINFVELNKQRTSLANKIAMQLNNGVLPPNYRKGVVPKYLRERKEAQQQKEQKAKATAPDPDCPEGHVPLPDNERKETLRMLKKNYQEFINELNKMPIKSDTLRCQRRKMEIEKQLNKLEEGMKVFSRPKVYVKVNE